MLFKIEYDPLILSTESGKRTNNDKKEQKDRGVEVLGNRVSKSTKR